MNSLLGSAEFDQPDLDSDNDMICFVQTTQVDEWVIYFLSQLKALGPAFSTASRCSDSLSAK